MGCVNLVDGEASILDLPKCNSNGSNSGWAYCDTTPSELRSITRCAIRSQGFKANPGLKFANTFGVSQTSDRVSHCET